MVEEFLFPLHRKNNARDVGNKAAGLHRLRGMGMRIPETYVLIGKAYRQYQQDHPHLKDSLAGEIARKLNLSKAYAVRSSANLEDGLDNSFAGQFQSVLDVCGLEALLQAVWSIWEAARGSAVREYLGRLGIQDDELRMPVIVQEMVPAVVSGVAFSRNPITGAREVLIEAVEGPGTRLVQDGITPYRWTFQGGEFTAQPESSPIPAPVIEEIARDTTLLARRSKKAIDLEWVYDGQQVYWVQMREITALGSLPVYSNKLAREMMGGLVKPLIWSINIPMVNGAWIRMLTEVIGPNPLTPFGLAKCFHYRAYFNMGLLGEVFESLGVPAESLEMMWGVSSKAGSKFKFKPGPRLFLLFPRVARFVWDKWTLDRRLSGKLPPLELAYRDVDLQSVPRLAPHDLVARIEQLQDLNSQAAYYNIVVPLSMYIYSSIQRGQLKKLGVDPTSFDMGQNNQALSQFNPAVSLAALHQKFLALEPHLQQTVRESTFDQVMQNEQLASLHADLHGLMQRFGHLADNGNDFSSVPWRENRDIILKLVTEYPARKEEDGNGKVTLSDLRLPLTNRWIFHRLYRRTQRFLLYREQVSCLYSYGYGLFRPHFLALGEYFTRRGWLDQPEDIFYLEWPAIRAAAVQDAPQQDLRAAAASHKAAMEQARSAVLPAVIYGDQPPPLEVQSARKLTGTATSRGYCTGSVCVVNGIQDFHKVKPGDILVIPFSEVSWTPLFACAAGVIAEAGGMLSHSSIIAREYGIPAVVSVQYAMQLTDGTRVTVDGYKGEIIVHEEEVSDVRS